MDGDKNHAKKYFYISIDAIPELGDVVRFINEFIQ